MSTVDLESILAPVSAAEPAGPDLGYDLAFGTLERTAQGKPAQQIGDTLSPGTDPDWKAVQQQALDLLAKTRDLRIAVYLTKALARTGGWAGFGKGLAVIRGLVEKYWDDGLHPRLDPDDGNDPTMRINVIKDLDAMDVLAAVRALPLLASPMLGTITLRDLEIALGEASPVEGKEAIALVAIEGSLLDCPIDALQATDAGLRSCMETLASIDAVMTSKVEAEWHPGLERLRKLVKKGADMVGNAASSRTGKSDGATDGQITAPINGKGRVAASIAGVEISSREDVLKALDKICAYYDRHEPSSPIPIFMQRCKRLVTMSFVDIVKELLPDGNQQLSVLRGSTDE
jgi:type VI secretion system protein ImpA